MPKSEISIALHCHVQSITQQYKLSTTCTKSTSVIKVTIWTIYITKGRAITKLKFLLSAKMDGTRRRTLIRYEECIAIAEF